MRRRIEVGAILFSVFVGLSSPHAYSQVAEIAYGFDEPGGAVVTDLTGNGHDGTLEGGATRNPNGSFGGAVEVDGVTGHVRLGTVEVSGAAMTITAWFKADDFGTGDARIISKASGTSAADHYWMVSTLRSNGYRLRFRLKTTVGDTTTLIADGATLTAGAFTHVAAVYDGTQMAIYQDGVLVGSTRKSGALVGNPAVEARIGSNPVGGRFFDGLIDNVRVYSGALSPAQIAFDMGSDGVPAFGPPLAPGNLSATAVASDRVNLTWTDNSVSELEFEIERSADDVIGPYQFVAIASAGTTSYSDTGLDASRVYCYRVRASNSAGPSEYTPPACATTHDPGPPSDPENLNVVPMSTHQIDLTWDDTSADETTFEIHRSFDQEAGPYLLIATLNAESTSYSDTGLDASRTYCYRVRAVNFVGPSGDTPAACATTDTPPPPVDGTAVAIFDFEGSGALVQDLTANGHDGTLENGATRHPNGRFGKGVEFDGVSGNIDLGGVGVGGDRISITAWFKPDDFGVGDARIISRAVGTAATDHYWMVSTIKSSGYRLRFRLKTTVGDTTTLVADGATLTAGVFTHVAAVYDGTQMTVYQDGSNVGSTAKTGSLIDDPAADTWIGANPVGNRVFDGIIDNVRIYGVSLTPAQVAVDRTSDGVPTFDPPPDPDGLLAAAYSTTRIDLTWNDNSTTETGFEIERSLAGLGGPYALLGEVGVDTTVYSDTNLSPSMAYCYRVRAVNEVGSSDFAFADCATTNPPSNTPAPSDVATIAVSHNQIDVTWNDNSTTETGFEVDRSRDDTSGPYVRVATVNADTTMISDPNLDPTTTYCYRVRAVDGNGPSDYAAASCATTEDPPPPLDPDGVVATAVSSTQIEVTWNDNSATETGFEIERSLGDIAGPYVLVGMVPVDTAVYSDTDLDPSTTYCYRVRAVNASGSSNTSGAVCATTEDPPPPIAPDGVVAAAVSSTQIEVTWNDNSATETGFEIERSLGDIAGPYVLVGMVTTDTTFYADPGRDPATTYCYRVRAVNDGGGSNEAPAACAMTEDPTAPNEPDDLVATVISSQQIDLSWDDNSGDETGFEIERSLNGGGGRFEWVAVVNSDTVDYSDLNLDPFVEYCYRVRAVNGGGPSGYATVACATTNDPPTGPTNLVATAVSSGQIDLVWDDNSNSETRFEVERSEHGSSGPYYFLAMVDPNTPLHSDVGLDPSTPYCYRVRAVNAVGPSGYTGGECRTTHNPTPHPLALAAYGFDEISGANVTDLTGNGHDGTLEGAAVRSAGGRFGAAVDVDGVSGRVNLGTVDVGGEAMTITAWFKADDFGTRDARIVSKATGTSEAHHIWMVSTVRSSGIRLRFRLKTTEGGTETLIADGDTLSAGVFTHVAAVYDGAEMAIYQDGVKVGSIAKTGLLVENRGVEAWIGANPVGGRFFDGLIDNVRIYPVALTVAQIVADMASDVVPLVGPPEDPTDLTADAFSSTQIDLSWKDNSTRETGFELERSETGSGGPYQWVASLIPDTVSYADRNLNSASSYCYRVRALNGSDASNYSSFDCAATHDPNASGWVSSIQQFGITWTFDGAYEAGRFVNDDYWIVGPVTVVSVNPPSQRVAGRVSNGSMINLLEGLAHGWDSTLYAAAADEHYADGLNVALDVGPQNPLVILPGSSLISSISQDAPGSLPGLKTVAVLTVLAVPPPVGSFRPPYAGSAKPLLNIAQIRTELLAKLPVIPGTPNLESIAADFERPWLEHVNTQLNKYHHPEENMPWYGRDMAWLLGRAAVLLHLDMPLTEKQLILIRLLQIGIDLDALRPLGMTWAGNGGHMVGRKFPIMFKRVMFGQNVDLGNDPSVFSEDDQTFFVEETGPGVYNYGYPNAGNPANDPDQCVGIHAYGVEQLGMPEWSHRHWSESPDIGRLDAGHTWSDGPTFECGNDNHRFCCTYSALAGHFLSAHIMGLRPAWNWEAAFEYIDRFMQVAPPSDRQEDPWTEQMWDLHRPSFAGYDPIPASWIPVDLPPR